MTLKVKNLNNLKYFTNKLRKLIYKIKYNVTFQYFLN